MDVGAADSTGLHRDDDAGRLRLRIRSVDDRGVVDDLVDRGIVCDVCPVSNLRTGAVSAMTDHPLAEMLDAGVLCSISTDDPAMFDTDLTREYETAESLGCSPQQAFSAGIRGALCDDATRSNLEAIGDTFRW